MNQHSNTARDLTVPRRTQRQDGRHMRANDVVAGGQEAGDLLLAVCGILAGDEFEAFLLTAARRLRLRGWVRREGTGALLRAIGTEEQLVQLVRAIRDEAPPSSRVRSMNTEAITAETPPVGDSFVPLLDLPGPEHGHDPHPPLASVA